MYLTEITECGIARLASAGLYTSVCPKAILQQVTQSECFRAYATFKRAFTSTSTRITTGTATTVGGYLENLM